MTGQRSLRRPPGSSFPVAFGNGESGIFGFLHPAIAGSPLRDTAVVLCNPIGWEAVASHRAYRHLAERLARFGFPVLRFDYPGTGDSSGSDDEPDRVPAWLSGIASALAEIQRFSGKPKVAMIGVHLGATLATLGAAAAGGIESLVLWAPYTKGRAFVREAKAYRALNAGNGQPPADEEGLEAAGFLLSASTLDDLSKLDLAADPRLPARNILLLEREGRPVDQALLAHFSSLGASVRSANAAGYQDLMQEPRKSVVPEATFDAILAYLGEVHPSLPNAEPDDSGPPRSSRHELRSSRQGIVSEEGITFGPDGRFFGIVTEPSTQSAQGADRPAILFLTTASHHRVGPNHMFVPMSRALAGRGFVSLRFDLTGIGDSPTLPGVIEGHAYAKSFVKDVECAMDHLEQVRGIRRFVTVGLCSGAFLGFHASLSDPRVAGAVLINPQTFNWREGDSLEINKRMTFMSTRFYKRAALEPETWLRAVRGEVNLRGITKVMYARLKKRAEVEIRRAMRRVGAPSSDGWVDVGDAFETLLARDADLFMIYGGNDEGLDYLTSEVGSRLRGLNKRSNFEMEVIDGPDHTFTQLWAQRRLNDLILNHIERRFR